MSQDSIHSPQQSRNKCGSGGLVNASSDKSCRRCGAPLADDELLERITAEPLPAAKEKKRGLMKRVIWICAATIVVLMIWYVSLLISSDGLQTDQREDVQNEDALLQQQGCSQQAFGLSHL